MIKFSSHSDLELDAIAFGTYQIPPGEATYEAVRDALEVGYRSIDTARYYQNEEDVGKAVKHAGIPVQITTKVWNDMHGYALALDSGRKSRDLLQVNSIDLLLVHWPRRDVTNMLHTWEALERLKEEGTVKHIGVSNFNQEHLEAIAQAGLSRPESNQVEINPMHTQESLRVYCLDHGIIVEAWCPLIKGHLDLVAELGPIAEKHQKSLAQVCIKWAVSSGLRVLAKSVHKERMRENLEVFDFELSSDEMNTIDALNKDFRQGPDPIIFE